MNNIIVAVPGSGKTTTIALNIGSYIKNKKVKPEKVYAVTFTREAARELKERTHNGIKASTIHSLAYSILNKIDNPDSIENADNELFYDSLLKNAMKSLNGFNADILAVDEAQDLSEIQYLFLRELAKRSKYILVVGDPNQSIFSFQGSNPIFINKFKEIRKTIKIKSLNNTYRMPAGVVDYINNTFNPDTKIISERTGGEVITNILPSNTIQAAIHKRLSENTGVLFRTNIEIINMARNMREDVKKVNMIIPLSAHPYASFAIAVIEMGKIINTINLLSASYLIGGVSWKAWRVLNKLKSVKLTKEDIEHLFKNQFSFINNDRNNLLIINPGIRKEIGNLIKVIDMYSDYHGDFSHDGISKLLTKLKEDKYILETFWSECNIPKQSLIEAIQKKILTGSDTYYKIDNNSTIDLMTIHTSKGNEFDNVLLSVNVNSIDIYEPEEFRILYVACTRAKKRLEVFLPKVTSYSRYKANIIDTMSRHAGYI